jgi:pilus assembly protein CpaC
MSEIKTTRRSKNRLRVLLLACIAGGFAAPASAWSSMEDPPARAGATTAPAMAGPDQAQLIGSGLDATGGKITLTSNQSRLIHTAVPIQTVDVTQPEVVTVKVVSPTDIMLTGRTPGSTQLVLWDGQGHSQSTDLLVNADDSALAAELKKALSCCAAGLPARKSPNRLYRSRRPIRRARRS